MITLTLEIHDELEAAIEAASHRRKKSPLVIVREVLETALLVDPLPPDRVDSWIANWRGRLKDTGAPGEAFRLAHLIAKHVH